MSEVDDPYPKSDQATVALVARLQQQLHAARAGLNAARTIIEASIAATPLCPAGEAGECATCDAKPDPSTCDHDVSCAKCGTRWHTQAEVQTVHDRQTIAAAMEDTIS